MADDDVVWRRGAVKKRGAEEQPGDHMTPQQVLTTMFHGIALSICAGTRNWASFSLETEWGSTEKSCICTICSLTLSCLVSLRRRVDRCRLNKPAPNPYGVDAWLIVKCTYLRDTLALEPFQSNIDFQLVTAAMSSCALVLLPPVRLPNWLSARQHSQVIVGIDEELELRPHFLEPEASQIMVLF